MKLPNRVTEALLKMGILLLVLAVTDHASAEMFKATEGQVLETYGKLPLSFEVNQGQTNNRVKFISRGNGYTLFLTSNEAVLALKKYQAEMSPAISRQGKPEMPEAMTGFVLRMTLMGAHPRPQVAALEQLPGTVNYFIGNDPKQWRINIPTYTKVKYQDVYPGVDLVFYGTQRQLEYDFVIAPGANPKAITLGFQGAERLEIDTQGDLILRTIVGEVRLRNPHVYQEAGGVTQSVAVRYVLKSRDQVGFEVDAYDASRPLIIDPVLVYSSYLGGTDYDQGHGIAVDASGHLYVTGQTTSSNFPMIGSSSQLSPGNCATPPNFSPCSDVFVAKLNPTGSAFVYSTYLGGNSYDRGYAIAVDTFGNAFVTGETASINFATTPSAFQTSFGTGFFKAFVTKLNPTGSLVYSTYLGSDSGDAGRGIAVAFGHAYVTGQTSSPNFPTKNPLQSTFGGGIDDGFVAKIDPSKSGAASLVYSTFLGGSGNDGGLAIAVDTFGNAYVTGETTSRNFPTKNPLQPTFGGGIDDGFVAKLDSAGSALVYSTYLGSSGNEYGMGAAVDVFGNMYVTGLTSSPNFRTTTGAFQTTPGGGTCNGLCFDAFVTKFNPVGSALAYSTYLGGSGHDYGIGISVDRAGNAYVTGCTKAPNFPTKDPLQAAGGGDDAFVTKLDPAGSALIYSTYLGGSGSDCGYGIAVEAAGTAHVTGSTSSPNFPTAKPLQPVYGRNSDAFITTIFDFVETGSPTPFELLCRRPAWLCPNEPPSGPGLIVLQCAFRGCQIADPLPRNCLIKFECPGCPVGGFCPPFYHVLLDGLDDAWNITLFDGSGNPAPHQQFKTPTGIVISFRPSKEHYIDGQIGDYFFVFEMGPNGKPGVEYPVRVRLERSDRLYGPKKPKRAD